MSLDYGIGLDTSKMEKDVEKANSLFKKIGDNAEKQVEKASSVYKIGAHAAAGLFSTAAASAFVKQLVSVRGEFQQLEIAFTTMLKSKERADKLLSDVTKFAATTPFDLQQVATGTKQLLAYGFAADSIQDNLSMLGNVASGVGSQIGDLIYLYGTLKASGRVTQMDINQFAGRGIPIYEELAKVLKTNVSEVRNFVSEGKVGFPQIEQAFKNMTNESGMFFNLMQEQSKSLSGQMSNLGDTISRALNEIGKSNEGILSEGISDISYLVENYDKVGKTIAELILTYGAYKAATMAIVAINQIYVASKVGMTAAEIANYAAITATEKAQKLLNETVLKNPYALAAAAIVALTYGFYKLITAQTEAEKSQSKLNETFKKNSEEITSEQVQIDTLFARLKAAKKGTEDYDAAKKAIFSKYGEYLKNLGDENTALNNIDLAYKSITESAMKAARARGLANATQQASDDLATQQANILEKLKKELDSKFGKDSKRTLDIYYQIRPLIQSGKGIEAFNSDFLKQFDETVFQQQGQFGGTTSYTKNSLKELMNLAVEAKKTFADINKEAEMLFGESPTKKPSNKLKEGDTKSEGGVDYVYKGGKWQVIPKTPTKEEAEKAKKTAQEKADIEIKIKNNTIKEGFEQRQAELDKQHAITGAMKDGFLKEKQIIEDDHQQKLLDIERRAQELIEKQQDEERLLWEKNGSKGVFKPKTTSVEQIDPENKNLISVWKQTIEISYTSNSDKLLKELNDTYASFNEKKRGIDLKYANEESYLKQTFAGDVLTEKLEIWKNLYTKELQSLQSEFFDSKGKDFNGLFELYLFGEGDNFIQQKIQTAFPKIKNFADATVKQLEEIKKYVDDIEFTPEQLETFKQLGIDVDKLLKNLKEAKSKENVAIDKDKWGEISDIVSKISSSASQLGDSLQGLGGSIGQIGSALSGVASQADNIMSILKKDAKTEDIISGGISGLASLIGMVANQIEENKNAQEEWNAKITEGQQKMALMRIEADAYKEANIFGVENPYSKAIAGAKQYSDAAKELYSQQSKLENGQVQTGTKKVVDWGNVGTGAGSGAAAGAAIGALFFGIGAPIGAAVGAGIGALIGAISTKTVPVFENLKSKYGELVDSSGNLNKKLLADYDKLDDETKKIIDNWDEIKKKQEDATKQMEENFKSLAGDLGTSLSDALIEAFKNRNLYSAIDKFEAKMNDVVTNIVQQLIFDQVFGQMFTDLTTEFKNSFGAGGDQNIVDDLEKFNKTYQGGLDLYNTLIEAANKELKNSGFKGFEYSQAAASVGEYKAITSDQASSIDGRLTAMQMIAAINSESLKTINSTLSKIDTTGTELRNIAIESWSELVAINKNTKLIKDTNDKLDSIIKNTDRL